MRASFYLFLEVVPTQLADHLLILLEGKDLFFGLGVQALDLSDLPREGRADMLILIHPLFGCRVGASCPSRLVFLPILLVLCGFDLPQDDILMLGLDNRIGSLRPLMLEHQIEKQFLYNITPINPTQYPSFPPLTFSCKVPNALRTDI